MQIELFKAKPTGISISAEDKYDTALAYIAEGFSSHRPQHIRTALQLLQEVEEGSRASSDLGKHNKMLSEVCGNWHSVALYPRSGAVRLASSRHQLLLCCHCFRKSALIELSLYDTGRGHLFMY